MRKGTLFLLLLVFQVHTTLLQAEVEVKPILEKLDRTLSDLPKYANIKENQILQSKKLLGYSSVSKEQEYRILGTLVSQYLQYNTDSCKKYIDRRMVVARLLNNPSYITEVNLNLAEWYKNIGMYPQAKKLLDDNRKNITPDLSLYYYVIFTSYYYMVEAYSSTDKYKKIYMDLSMVYRDSLLQSYPKTSVEYMLTQADQMRLNNKFQTAIKRLKICIKKVKADDSNIRLIASGMAQCYLKLGQTEEAKYYFALSAISDIQHSVKENTSLRSLAVILFQEGDIERANNYLQFCMKDANDCKARLREVEAASEMPTIVRAYQKQIERKNQTLWGENIALLLFVIALILTVYFIVRQNRRLEVARKNVLEANLCLEEMNKQLNVAVEQEKRSNVALIESNCIKDEYIAQYLNLCSSYLEKMEEYRHSLIKIGSESRVEKLFSALRSSKFVEDQLKDFYINFDHTFLRLFPTFIIDFNEMLLPEERIELKSDGQISTEMRIFALIRLGITDSNCLAKFLRCSLQTVYNYRSKIRTKTINKEEHFEEKIKTIGSIHT
ncbi:DUF6377 domain-containing protein [uncultured Bacteroides sp.]|uniref:DUF6377 domain-containing protein n=1 Tax=uncultured Bacteroides sp. TaxID=162156 RepID=UPI002AA5E568|nr:DUF6377 domain-containing protein [uncultured Bacteroides sp.]